MHKLFITLLILTSFNAQTMNNNSFSNFQNKLRMVNRIEFIITKYALEYRPEVLEKELEHIDSTLHYFIKKNIDPRLLPQKKSSFIQPQTKTESKPTELHTQKSAVNKQKKPTQQPLLDQIKLFCIRNEQHITCTAPILTAMAITSLYGIYGIYNLANYIIN